MKVTQIVKTNKTTKIYVTAFGIFETYILLDEEDNIINSSFVSGCEAEHEQYRAALIALRKERKRSQ